jgi:hypothetical protein
MHEDLEAQVAEFPEERAEILREAAHAWREAGEPARAERILRELVAEEGEDGCWARIDLIDTLLAQNARRRPGPSSTRWPAIPTSTRATARSRPSCRRHGVRWPTH